MSFKPLGNRVLVLVEEAPEETAGGIIILKTANNPEQGASVAATVIAVGDGDEIDVEVDNVVLVAPYGGTKVTLDSKGHLVVNVDDILAVVEG